MFRKIAAAILAANLLFTMNLATAAPKPDKSNQTATQQGPRRHLANIIFAGLAGAILGLSTLSFYGRPQDRLSNIAAGFAIGVIAGTLYTTYKAAAEPKEFYSWRETQDKLWAMDESFNSQRREAPLATSFTFQF